MSTVWLTVEVLVDWRPVNVIPFYSVGSLTLVPGKDMEQIVLSSRGTYRANRGSGPASMGLGKAAAT